MGSSNTVKVKITGELDKSFQSALNLAQSGLKGLGKVGMMGLKGAGMGIAAATAGVAALGKAAVKTGSEFESSMSQVAATMLIDKNDVEGGGAAAFKTLEEAARECGRTTAFSASEAAEGLNYLALAGYDADQAATALPTVLRLAGAGAMELAEASDMVTDSMSALGIAATQENLEGFGDKLAKTASKSNTSVSQLGEALIKVGGTAKGLSGGVTEASTALGILADSGIKGAEGGTHLRNMIMSLQNPRNKKAGELMSQLDISAYDEATGKMKSLGDTFADLNAKLEGNTAAENNSILSSIFKQTDLAAAKAMMAATANSVESLSSVMDASLVESGQSMESLGIDLQSLADSFDKTISQEEFATQMNKEFGMSADNAGVLFSGLQSLVGDGKTRFEELSAAIADSEGAAEDMYNIQLDNLQGDVSKLKSAFDDLKISIYEDVGGPVRDVTQLGTQMITNVSNAYADGGMGAAVAQLGTEAANAVTLIAQNAPALINVGAQLIQNLVSGIQSNLPAIASGAANAAMAFVGGVFQVAPVLLVTGAQAILMFAQGIVSNLPSIIVAGVNAVASFIHGIVPMIPQLFQLGIQAVVGFVQGLTDSRGTILSTAAELIGGLVSGIIQSIPQLLLAVPQIVSTLVGGILSTDWIQVGKDILGGLWSGLTGGGDDSGKGQAVGANIATNYAAGIQANQYQVQGALDGMLTGVDTSGMTAAGAEAGTAFTTSFSESLAADASAMGVSITSMVDAATTASADLGTVGTDSGTLFTDNLTAAIDTGGVNAVASIDTTTSSIKSAVDAVDLTPSGAHMMQGLVTGMESKRAQVMQKARSIAEAASKAVNEALDVHSPSRVMMKTGEYVGEGLAIGMEGQQPDIKAAAETMSAPVSGGIGGILKDTLSAVTGNGGTTNNNTQNAPSTFNFNPTYVFEGQAPDKEAVVEANRMSQNEFARMMEEYMHRNARLSFA